MKSFIIVIGLFFVQYYLNAQDSQIETVTGTVVTEKDYYPIPYATIRIKGTTIKTSSDKDGNFIIKIPKKNKILIVSANRRITREIIVKNITQLTISLKEKGDNYFDLNWYGDVRGYQEIIPSYTYRGSLKTKLLINSL